MAVAAAAVDDEGSGQGGTNSHAMASSLIAVGDKQLKPLNESNSGTIQNLSGKQMGAEE